MHKLSAVLFAASTLLACGGAGDAAGLDASTDAQLCQTPELSPEWLTEMQSEVVAKLAGAQPISSGVTLSDRASEAARARTQVFIEEQLASFGYEIERHEFVGQGPGTNVLARLNGREEGAYLVGAHFDSVPQSPGANDNATGVAAVLALARILAESEDCLGSGIVFAFFDQEELGLLGSRALAETFVQEDAAILGVITLDQLGWDDNGDLLMEVELPAAGMLDAIRASANRHGFVLDLVETNTAGSDHTAFREQGFPAMGITEGFVSGDTTPHYHQSTDTFETVDLGFLAHSTSVLAGYVSDLAGL